MATGIRRSSVSLTLLLALLAACEERAVDPPATASREVNPGRVPAPPPPPPPPPAPPRYEYPVWREPAHPRFGEPVRDPVVRPRLIESVEPEYSEEARKKRISGIVVLELVVEADGRVSGGRVLKPLPFGLTDKAIEAVKHWRFKPAEHPIGTPVRAIHNATVNFKL